MNNSNKKDTKDDSAESSTLSDNKNTNSIFESETVISPIFDQTTANAASIKSGKARLSQAIDSMSKQTTTAKQEATAKQQEIAKHPKIRIEDFESQTAELPRSYIKDDYQKLIKVWSKFLQQIKTQIAPIGGKLDEYFKINQKTVAVGMICLGLIIAALSVSDKQQIENMKLAKSVTENVQPVAAPNKLVANPAMNPAESKTFTFNSQQDFLSFFEKKSAEAREHALGQVDID